MLIIGILFMAILLIFSTTIFSSVRSFINFGTNSNLKEQARHVAEAGIDYAIKKIADDPTYTGTGAPIDFASSGSFKVVVDQLSQNLKTVTVTGYVPKFLGFKTKTTIQISIIPSGDSGSVAKMEGSVAESAVVENNNYIYSLGGVGSDGSKLRGINPPFWTEPDVQFSQINSGSGYLEEPFHPALLGQFPETRRAAGAVAANGYIYVIAGKFGLSSNRSTVFFTQPDPATGEITSWSTDADSPTLTSGAVDDAFVYNNYVYIIQGQKISYAPLEAGGFLGAWTQQTANTPTGSSTNAFVIDGLGDGYIYHFIQGELYPYEAQNVYYAKVNTTTHAVETFTKIPNVLPATIAWFEVTAANGYIYVMGGKKIDDSSGSYQYPNSQSVYYQKIKSNHTLDPFLSSPKNLPDPRSFFGSISRNNKLFLFGGWDPLASSTTYGNIWVTDVDAADVDSDGDTGEISDWTDNGGLITYSGWAPDKTTYVFK